MEWALTEWEKWERNGLLALETPEWREKRAIASDPDTTGDTLARLADKVDFAWYVGGNNDHPNMCLLAEAIVAHPNTTPDILIRLLDYRRPLSCAALCRNPVVFVLGLEVPDFWRRIQDITALGLLSQEALPRPVVEAFQQNVKEAVAQAARLHRALAKEIQTQNEGTRTLTDLLNHWSEEQTHRLGWHENKVVWQRLLFKAFASAPQEFAPPIVALSLDPFQQKTIFAVFSSHYGANSLHPEIYLGRTSWQLEKYKMAASGAVV